MKICSPQLGLSPQSELGGEVHDFNVLSALAKRGHQIFVYLPKDRQYEVHKNLNITVAPIKHIPAITFNLLVIPYLFKTYKKEKFDVLRVHNPYFVGLGALIFKMFHPEIPIVATHHLAEDDLIFDLINKFTAKRYDAIIAVSNHVKNWLINAYDVDKNKITTIYNGVDYSLKLAAKNEALIKKYNLKGKTVLFFMGLLVERKNPMFLLEIYKKVKETKKDTALIICGSGPLEGTMRDFVNANNLADVIFAGAVFGKEKNEYLNLCDIFVLPSKNEGFGIVIAEAMSCGKIPIVSKNTSLAEIVRNGKDGLTQEGYSPHDWSRKIIDLINTPSKRAVLSKNASIFAKENFNWDKIIISHEKLLLNVTNS